MKDFENDFNEFISNYDFKGMVSMPDRVGEPRFYDFLNLPFSMQWGVYLEFFDSVGIYIQVETRAFDKKHPIYLHFDKGDFQRVGIRDTRQQAQKEAIKKAIEIYNIDYKK